MSRAFAILLGVVATAGAAGAQGPSSPNFVLLDDGLDGGGGGECSPAFASFHALAPLSGATMTSTEFDLVLGFLGVEDPSPTNAPVIFGVTPGFGPMAGGTAIAIAGLNFDKFGVGPSILVDVAGVPATGVVVVSNTHIDALSPAGPSGPNSLTVSSSFGSDTLPEGFIHTPAVLSSPAVMLGGSLELKNYGPTSAILFDAFASPSLASMPSPFGTIFLDTSILFNVIEDGLYPAPNGIHLVSFPVPTDPSLSGLNLHFQTAVMLSSVPQTIVLTNRSTSVLS